MGVRGWSYSTDKLAVNTLPTTDSKGLLVAFLERPTLWEPVLGGE